LAFFRTTLGLKRRWHTVELAVGCAVGADFAFGKIRGWFKVEFGDLSVVGGTDVDGEGFVIAKREIVDVEDVKEEARGMRSLRSEPRRLGL